MPEYAAVAVAQWAGTAFSHALGSYAVYNTVAATAYAATYIATSAALSYGLSAIAGDAGARDNPGSNLDTNVAADALREIIIGERLTGGSRVGLYVTGPGNNNLIEVIALADHRCEGALAYYANGIQYLSNLVHGVRTSIADFRSGGDRLWVTWYDGRQSQAVDANLAGRAFANQPDWTVNHRGRGVSYAIVEMQWDDDVMLSPVSSSFLMRGGRWYDRRQDTTAGGSGDQRHKLPDTWQYNQNPDVFADHYQLGIVPYDNANIYAWGPGLQPWQLPYDVFAEEADISDEQVLKKDGVTYQTRYQLNAIFNAGNTHRDILIKCARAKAGQVVDRGGRLAILGPQARTPVMTLYDSDLIVGEQSKYSDKLSVSDLFNSFRGTFPDPAQLFRPVEYPRLTDPDWVAADGGDELSEDVDIDVDTDSERVQRLVWLHAQDRRRQARLTECYKPIAFEIEKGDWFERTGARFPDGKLFECIRIEYMISPSKGMYVLMTSKEVDPDDVAWTGDMAADLSAPPAPTQEAEFALMAPPVLGVAAFAINGNGTTLPAIGVVISNADDTRIRQCFIEVTTDGGGSEKITKTIDAGADPLTANACTIDEGILPGVDYLVRARFLGLVKPSEWSAVYTVTATADFIVPQAGSAAPGSPLADYLDAISDALDNVVGPGPYGQCFPFWQVGGPGDIGDVEIIGAATLKVNAGQFSHISLGEVLIDETEVQTPWGVYYAPPFGAGGLAWSQEDVSTRFSNGAGSGHLFSFAYDADGTTLRAYGLDRNAGEVFTPEDTDAVLAVFYKPLAPGSDELSTADGIVYADTLIRIDAVMQSRIETVSAESGAATAAVSTLTIALATETSTRASETTTLTANLATANANISTNTTAIATETAARASADSTLTANLGTANAAITANSTAIATETATRASETSTLTTNLGIANAAISSNATAISTEVAARTSADSTLTASVGSLSSSVSTNATAIAGVDGRISAFWGIKVAAGTNVATIEALASGGGVPSTVIINAGQIQMNGAVLINGSVTAAKMSVTSLDAITATIGLLRTVTTGERMELASNQLRAYNSSNVLVLELGILS